MANPKSSPSVFNYLDYRRFLEDYFSTRKMEDYRFSLRGFAKHAGLPLSYSSFFTKVIAGKRNLTIDLRFKLAKAMKLTASELSYFELLVQFNQSKNEESKQHFYAALAKYKKSPTRIITKDRFEFYAKWQNSVIRAFFGIRPKERNAESIGQEIFPQLTVREVEEAVRLLLKLGLITKTANGYAVTDPHITMEPDQKNFSNKTRIVEMLNLAKEVMPHIPTSDLEYSTMTVYVSHQGFQELRERVRSFREDLKALVASDREEDRVYTVNIQLFPNTILPEWGPEAVPKKKP